MNMTNYKDNNPMIWDSKFSVGAPELDTQHRELMTFFNDALRNCTGNKTEEKEYFEKTIDAFINTLSTHFKTEEQHLFGKSYPRYDEHKLDHTKLLEKINFVTREAKSSRWEMKLFIMAITLKDWLMYHLEDYDASAKDFFSDKVKMHASEERYSAVPAY